MSRPIKIFITTITLIAAVITIFSTRPKLGNYSWFFLIVPIIAALLTYFWELIIRTLRGKTQLEAQIEALQEMLKDAQDKTSEKAQIEEQIEALREEASKEVQFFPGNPSKASGLDSEEAIEIIREANADIHVTHFISNEPSSDLLEVISQLEKSKNFHRMVYFQDNIQTEDERKAQYSWLIERINHGRTENKFILERPLPLDFLIVDTNIVMIELPNIVSNAPNLLVIKKEGVANAFRDIFLGVFYDKNRSTELTTQKLEQYFSTGKIIP